MVEFAILSPILILVMAGMLDLGRAYYYEVATTDAARDGARYASGIALNPPGKPGPGFKSVCDRATADLANVTLMGTAIANVQCVQATTLPATTRPFYPPSSYSPAPNQAIVVIFCPDGTCQGTTQSATNAQLSVTVYYGFSLLTPGMNNFIGASALTLANAAVMTSLW